ncbi:MAG: fatty acid desaturase [Janthinobacterium lividum]
MNTSTSRVLSGAEVRALSVRSNTRGAARTALHGGALALAGAGVALSNAWTLLPAMLLLGVLQSALFAPIHETMHQTVFRSRRANAVVGWLAACPSLLNLHFYTAFHLAHHRFTQDPDRDPELAPRPPSNLDTYLLRVLGVNYWRARGAVIRDCWRGDLSGYPYIPGAAAPRVVRSVRAMCVFMATLALGSAAVFGWWVPFAFWIVPQLLGQPLLRLYLLTEHTECTLDANGLTNTRTTLTNGLMRLLMWNMSFHTEHHLYPSIPFHRLPDAHAAVRNRLGVVQDGYARWHRGYLADILRGA